MIKAIETLYAGYRFRSRLEARWAVFFNALGIEWQYEPQGFEIGTGCGSFEECKCDGWPSCACDPATSLTRYLPDFYLPQEKLWIEVKGVIDSDPLLTLAVHCLDPWSGPTLPDGDRLMIVGELPPPHSEQFCMHEIYYWRKGTARELAYFDTRHVDREWRPEPLIRPLNNWGSVNGLSDCYDGTAVGGTPTAHSYMGEVRPYWIVDNGITLARRQFDWDEKFARKFSESWFGPAIKGGNPYADPAVTAAYDTARQARFEHGETPRG